MTIPTKNGNEVTRVLCSKKQLRGLMSRLRASGVTYMVGHNSIYVMKYRLKLIDKTAAIEHPDKHGEIKLMTSGEIARTEMRRLWPNLKRVGWRRESMPLLDARWPMAFRGQYKGPLMYIDLVSAYAQLYKRLWLDIAWPCGFGQLDMFPLWEKVSSNKRVRNAVIGIVRSNGASMVYKKKIKTVPSRNAFLSPPLWATVQALLNEVANIALEFGAKYIMTDGYLIPYGDDALEFCKVLDYYGLTYRKHVDKTGHIKGWMSYEVGPKSTKLYRDGKTGGERIFTSVNVPFADRPLKMLTWWAFDILKYRERNGLQW